MKKKIGIVGYGYVGKAMYEFFKGHYELKIYDPAIEISATQNEMNDCDVAFVCVPTPQKDDGSCDISLVRGVLKWLKCPLVVIKSTVPPGTTQLLQFETDANLVFSPEYCGESSYWTPYKFHTDVKETPFFIFGGNREHTTQLVDLYLKVTGPTKIYRQTDSDTAEMAKYMANTFAATKIAYCYEIAQICEKADMDFNEVRELWLLDPRINPMHTAVFKENDKPFSGKCLPKDLSALIKFAQKYGYGPGLLLEVAQTNESIGRLLREAKESKMATQ